jgi:hypothetical protein
VTSVDDILHGCDELDEHQRDYEIANEYFDGTRPEFFASIRMKRLLQKTGTSFRTNIAKKAVTAVTDRLEISSIRADPKEATTVIEDLWNGNELDVEMPIALRKTCTLGDGYFFVWPNEDETGVDIEFSGPLTTRAIYDPEHPRQMKYVIKRWTTGRGESKRTRVNLYYFGKDDGRVEKWVTREGSKGTDPVDWIEYEPTEENPFGKIVFHLRTDRPYGAPLHKEAFGAQDAINKLNIVHMNTIDYAGAPQRVALLDGAAEGDSDDFDDFDDDFDPEVVAHLKGDSEQTAKLKNGPGELWLLEGVKSISEFTSAPPDRFLAPADYYMRMAAQCSDMPLHFFSPSGDQPSGDSRRTAEGSLSKKLDWLALSFGGEIANMLEKAAEIRGSADVKVHVVWAPAAQVDDLQSWQTVGLKLAAGVPFAQVMSEQGYTDEQIQEWQNEKAKQPPGPPNTAALRDLGTAKQLGVINDQQHAAILQGMGIQ